MVLGQHGAVALGKMQMVLKELGAAPPDTSPCSDAVCPIAECPTRWKKPPAFGDRSTLVSVQAFTAGCPIAGREPEAQKGIEKPVCVSYRQQSANVGSPHPPEASTRCWSHGGHSSAGLCWLRVGVFFVCFNFFHDEETAEIPSQILLWHHPSHVARRMPGADSAPGLCWLRNVSSTGKSHCQHPPRAAAARGRERQQRGRGESCIRQSYS